jgi:Bacterial PH domain
VNNQPDIVPTGLPDHLPEGERLLWQGRPDWKRLALNAFHVRKVAFYFLLIIVVQAAARIWNQQGISEAMRLTPYLILMAVVACGILLILAYANAKTTLYTLTNRRLLMKVGIALPAYINIPLHHIDSASYADTGKGCGTIIFRTAGSTRLAYLLLWPHARPWKFKAPQPALRDVPRGEAVAELVAKALGGMRIPVDHGSESAQYRMLVAAE